MSTAQALVYAVLRKDNEQVKRLLTSGADANVNYYGARPLDKALAGFHCDISDLNQEGVYELE